MQDTSQRDPLAYLLTEALAAAQHRYRTRRGFGAIVTPAIPLGVIEELAQALTPVIRAAAADAVAQALDGATP